MPHADSSYFTPGLSKNEVYQQVLEQTRGLVYGQRNWVSNLANVSSLLWHAFASLPSDSPSSSVNWTGFYVRADKFPVPAATTTVAAASSSSSSSTFPGDQEQSKPENPNLNLLLLGPFHGKPACQQILFGKGVCGTAADKRETVLVHDVLSFPGHIACDAESRSEVVVPVLVLGETVAIIDIDCTEKNGFDEVDKKNLEDLASLLAEACDW